MNAPTKLLSCTNLGLSSSTGFLLCDVANLNIFCKLFACPSFSLPFQGFWRRSILQMHHTFGISRGSGRFFFEAHFRDEIFGLLEAKSEKIDYCIIVIRKIVAYNNRLSLRIFSNIIRSLTVDNWH